MGEFIGGTADVVVKGLCADLAEHVYAIVRAPAVTRLQSEVDVLTTDLQNAINNWSVSGRATAETAGATPLGGTHQDGISPTAEAQNIVDSWCRDIAEKVYARIRARDVVRVQAEVDILVTDLKNAINTWLILTPTAETAGTGSPFNVNL